MFYFQKKRSRPGAKQRFSFDQKYSVEYSAELSQECLFMILSLNVWQTFYLPVLGLKVASHFKQTAISQSCASSFLSNILTKFCQNSDFDSVCHSVFSDLANQNGKILFLEKTKNLLQS
jgi:hypothetical protein